MRLKTKIRVKNDAKEFWISTMRNTLAVELNIEIGFCCNFAKDFIVTFGYIRLHLVTFISSRYLSSQIAKSFNYLFTRDARLRCLL